MSANTVSPERLDLRLITLKHVGIDVRYASALHAQVAASAAEIGQGFYGGPSCSVSKGPTYQAQKYAALVLRRLQEGKPVPGPTRTQLDGGLKAEHAPLLADMVQHTRRVYYARVQQIVDDMLGGPQQYLPADQRAGAGEPGALGELLG